MFLNSILISLKLCKQLPPPTAITTTTTTAIENTFYHLFQKELFAVILKQINLFPSKITKQSLRFFGKIALDIALTNKSFYHCLKNTIVDLSKMYSLYSKYSNFNSQYESPYKDDEYNFLHPPILIDALNSGCHLPFAGHSHDVVNFDDIKEIIRLMPDTIYSDLGKISYDLIV